LLPLIASLRTRYVSVLARYSLFFLPLLLLLPSLNAFPYTSDQSVYSDLAITHYPNALF
jgi:hypothetical protein